MDAGEIEARLAIEDTIGRYVRCVDGGRAEDLKELFIDDGVLQTDRNEYRGRDAISGMIDGLKASLSSGAEPRRIRHHVSSLRIDFDGPDAATATCYFLSTVGDGVDHWGVYRDQFVRDGDRWLFAHRHVTTEGRTPGGWAASRVER